MTGRRLWLRLAGVLLIVICLVVLQPGSAELLHRLVVPLLLALGAYWLVQNLAAVALGAAVLAAVHSDLNADDWVEGLAYPLLAACSAAVVLIVALQRFARRISRTHEDRWRRRANPAADNRLP